MNNQPRVSVVMAVYNGASFVNQAVESILDQTFTDFELILIEDGSTDETPSLLREYDDPRIRLIENGQNIGLTRSLNRGIQAACGEFIARQDADDYSLPQRLERQIAYLEEHPRVGLVGSWARWVNGSDELINEWQPITDPASIHSTILWTIPFLHGTFMFRRECLEDIGGGYDETFPVAQDCNLLLRISERWDLANCGENLYVHRRHDDTVTAHRSQEQQYYLRQAQIAAIERRLRYGWSRLRGRKRDMPGWLFQEKRRWLAQRCVWWSAGARQIDCKVALQFLVIAFLLDPTAPEIWTYVFGILSRKIGITRA